jgi:hypothetical protein
VSHFVVQVLVVLIYGALLYIIMAHIARNLSMLGEQLQQIQDEGVHVMHAAVHYGTACIEMLSHAVTAATRMKVLNCW